MGEAEWTWTKEVLAWNMGMKSVTVTFPYCNIWELFNLIELLASQHCMILEVVELLRNVFHLYHLQNSLAQGVKYKAWIFPDYHWDPGDWNALVGKTEAHTTLLA